MTEFAAEARCRGCRWWDTPWSESNETPKPPFLLGDDDPEKPIDDIEWGVCVTIGHAGGGSRRTWNDQPVPGSQRAFTADGSNYWSALSTRSDFGCVEWEAKP